MTQTKPFHLRRILEFAFGVIPALFMMTLAFIGVVTYWLFAQLGAPYFFALVMLSVVGTISCITLIISIWRDSKVQRKQLFISLLVLGLVVAVLMSALALYLWQLSALSLLVIVPILSVCVVSIGQIKRLGLKEVV
jgi:hypothetical protein